MRKGEFIEETLGVAEREDILQNGNWMAVLCVATIVFASRSEMTSSGMET